jgi:Skp family chaperone for outer membrane proteins
MKSSLLKSLLLVGLTAFGAVGVQAQPTPKIAVVDLAKLFSDYWMTGVTNNKINAETNSARDQAKLIVQAHDAKVKQANDLFNAATNNPAITTEAKDKAQKQLNEYKDDMNAEEKAFNDLNQTITSQIQKEQSDFKTTALIQIIAVATRVAKDSGANMLIDKSNSTIFGTSNFLYISTDYKDLTDAVLKELNKDAPPMPAAATPAADPKK